MHELFGEPIHVYTRAEALEDGTLVDVSETAKEAGFAVPVALTSRLYADCDDLSGTHATGGEDTAGRLWDLLYMAALVARREDNRDSSEFIFDLIMPVGEETYYRAKCVIGPGDSGEPVITLMLPEED